MKQIPAHNGTLFYKLLAEGYSYDAASLIASTEMEGSNTLPNGDIHARQTHCGELNYSESIRDSAGVIEGRKVNEQAVQDFLTENGYKTLEEYYMSLGLEP